MCGRYGFGNPARFASLELGVLFPDLNPRFNVAPTQSVPLVVQDGEQRQALLARWGLVPFWANDVSIGSRLVNARGETVREKPAFRSAFRTRRGLMPAEFFYEWQKAPGAKGRLPWRINRSDGTPFAFGALWERWRDKAATNAEAIVSCTIITTTPNSLMAPIHDRMPVVVDPADFDRWLSPRTAPDDVEAMIRPCDPAPWEAVRVSTWVNAPAHDDPRCSEEIEE